MVMRFSVLHKTSDIICGISPLFQTDVNTYEYNIFVHLDQFTCNWSFLKVGGGDFLLFTSIVYMLTKKWGGGNSMLVHFLI